MASLLVVQVAARYVYQEDSARGIAGVREGDWPLLSIGLSV